MMKSELQGAARVNRQLHAHASFTAMAAGIPSICMDGGMTSMVPVRPVPTT